VGFKNILYESDSGAVTITISRPERRNALNLDTVHELMAALARVNAEPSARVLVITGAGDAFCAGADLKDAPEMDPQVAHEVVRLYLDYIAVLRSVEIPVIARINGDAVGGGCCTALACDIRVASERARLGFPFAKLGISGADMGSTYLLPRLIGYGRAAELLLIGDLIPAQEAQAMGLVNRVVPVEELDAAVESLVARLVSGPPLGLRLTKKALTSALDKDAATAFDYELLVQSYCLLSDDYQEGLQAFREKRSPQFRGR
jgi:2-(1,2-epoxy-1,2-dihydrophenyl)acetyl-CoA isomerase